jgi:hypothetical protein
MIAQIIELLSDNEKSLVTPLLKTQVLSSRLDNENLNAWVSRELNGFNYQDELPNYRLAAANAFGVMKQNGRYFPDQALPVSIYGKNLESFLIKHPIYSGVAAIEEIASGKLGAYVVKPFSADFCRMLDDKAMEGGHGDIKLKSGRTQAHINEFTNVLAKIRGHFLNMLLQVEKQQQDTNIVSDSNKREINQTISQFMTQINIHTQGDGNIITAGNNNNVNATVKIDKGNLEQLKAALLDRQVSFEDAEEAISIVQSESPDVSGFGPLVKVWMGKMLQKSVEGTWDVSVAVAGGILVEILKKYYGM